MKKLLNNKIFHYILLLGIGVTIGVLFYPTKKITERIKTEHEEEFKMQSTIHKILTKKLTLQIDSLKEEKTKLTIETSQKITKLTYQVRELQSKKKETFYKLIKPDGTIEEKRFTESEVNESSQVVTKVREEFDQKVTKISERWQRVHTTRVRKLKREFDKKESTYKKTISKMESEKITDINPKKYGVELGYTADSNYYGHVNIDVFGPVFLGLHTETDFGANHTVGAGIGIRF